MLASVSKLIKEYECPFSNTKGCFRFASNQLRIYFSNMKYCISDDISFLHLLIKRRKKLVHRIIYLIGVILLTACSSLATHTPHYTVLSQHNLPDELKETSGLYCPEVGSAFTVNDSGNEPIIYKIDHMGQILGEQVVASKNTDWEALTGDSQYFYIGDIGNNNGKRKFVQIHAVPKNNQLSEADVTTSRIFYINNVIEKNEYVKHDFDAETLINLNDSLLLFSKSWKTGTLFIYQLNKEEPNQYVEHVSEIEGLPGVVTGGDFDSKNNRFILVGYGINAMRNFNPFIAILNRDLTLLKSFEVQGFGQMEGICVTPNGEIWFTQESSVFSNHKIVKLKLVD